MIVGNISAEWDLLVPIRVLDKDEYVHRFEAVVDTGFNGHLTLPPHLIQEFGPPLIREVDMVVATDMTVRVNSYDCVVLWQNQRLRIPAMEAEGAPLIGIGLLWGSLLTAEITDNGEVAISPLPAETRG